MKISMLLPSLFLLILLSPAHASEVSPIPSLVDKFMQSGSSADGAMAFKHCAALSNTLLNAYKKSPHDQDDGMHLGTIDKWSLKTANHVELASYFSLGVKTEAAEVLDSLSGKSVENRASIFDENYYDLLRFYTTALQNPLSVVERENNQSVFVVDIDSSVRRCNELLANYCDLKSLDNCSI